ncbi:hypothetical protein VE04_10293 [Pseudogymnoascus sp. 24MN13]|nr:hypothetical protein VE04_10293 [Pseudogymnoascus sp. 24MN13]
MIESAITTAIAAGKVPAGIKADYLMENRDAGSIGGILVVAVLAVLVVCARLYTRLFFSVSSFGLDDSLIVFTAVIYITFIGLSIKLLKMNSGRHIEYIQYVMSNDDTNKTEVYDFVAHLIYTTALYVCRVSGLVFYMRLCDRHNTLLQCVKAAFVFMTVAYIPQMFLIIFHCLPVTGLWPYSWQPELTEFTCMPWGVVYITNSSISLVSDLVVFAIPAALVGIFRASLMMKFKLSLVLFPGVIVIVISCVRLYLVLEGLVAIDISWPYGPMLAIESAEIGATMIALSVPALKPLFGSLFTKFTNSYESRSKSTRNGNSVALSGRLGHSHKGLKDGSAIANLNPYQQAASETTIRGGKGNQLTGSDDDLLVGPDVNRDNSVRVTTTIKNDTNSTSNANPTFFNAEARHSKDHDRVEEEEDRGDKAGEVEEAGAARVQAWRAHEDTDEEEYPPEEGDKLQLVSVILARTSAIVATRITIAVAKAAWKYREILP